MHDNGEEKTDIVVLIDEEGIEHDFALIDRFHFESEEYAILVPVIYSEEGENGEAFDFEDEAYIFRVDSAEGEEMLVEVEDEKEWHQVASAWEERAQNIEYEDDDDLL